MSETSDRGTRGFLLTFRHNKKNKALSSPDLGKEQKYATTQSTHLDPSSLASNAKQHQYTIMSEFMQAAAEVTGEVVDEALAGRYLRGGKPNWDLSGGLDKEEYIFLAFYAFYMIVVYLLYWRAVMKPLKLLAVFVHEMGYVTLTKIMVVNVTQQDIGERNLAGRGKPGKMPSSRDNNNDASRTHLFDPSSFCFLLHTPMLFPLGIFLAMPLLLG